MGTHRRRRGFVPALAAAVAWLVLGLPPGQAHAEAEVDPPERWSLPGDRRGALEVDGRRRTFALHVPQAAAEGRPLPLVLFLHGGGGDADRIRGFSGLDAVARREGFFAAYPEAVERRWNDGRPDPRNDGVDDIAFLLALVDALVAAAPIDPARVYAAGASNGAMMSYRLACEAPERFAAVAAVIGLVPEALARDAPPAESGVPVLIMASTADRLVPWEGGEVRVGRQRHGRVLSAAATVAFWVERNRCDPEPVREDLPDLDPEDGTRVRRDRYGGGSAEVVFYAIEGGGHTWPSSRRDSRLVQALVGRTSRDVDATEEIVAFFLRHARPAAQAPPR